MQALSSCSLEEDERFEVESIVDSRTSRSGGTEYCIKWKGYESSQNTWEPEENLDCAQMLDAFRRSQAAKYTRRFWMPCVHTQRSGVDPQIKGLKKSSRLRGGTEVDKLRLAREAGSIVHRFEDVVANQVRWQAPTRC